MSSNSETILIYTILAGLLSIVYCFFVTFVLYSVLVAVIPAVCAVLGPLAQSWVLMPAWVHSSVGRI